jgi:hypothetical protein
MISKAEGAFDIVLQHAAVFARDGLRTLVARLRVSVIKAGLRKIASASVEIHTHSFASSALCCAFLTRIAGTAQCRWRRCVRGST